MKNIKDFNYKMERYNKPRALFYSRFMRMECVGGEMNKPFTNIFARYLHQKMQGLMEKDERFCIFIMLQIKEREVLA